MKRKIIVFTFILFSLLIAEKSWSGVVKISGKAPEYAMNSIELYNLHDFITEEKVKLGTLRFNADGTFNLAFDIPEITLCLADFDSYQGMLYLEPGKSYEVIFPPKRTLTVSQKRNPFVKPELVWFGIANPEKNELNVKIQMFEQEYAKLENKYFDQIYSQQAKSLVDTIKLLLDNNFPKTGNSFFESHKLYRKANLDFALNQAKSADFMKTYFSSQKPVFNLEAYAVIFNQVFTNYFNLTNDVTVRKLVIAGSLAKLDEYFQNKLYFNKDLAHLILLRSLNDAYYSKQFVKATILKMLDQVKAPAWSDYELKTAQIISSKLVYLASGTYPPALPLKNINGQNVSFSEYKSTYIYLHFTDPKNTICRQHLDALKEIAARYKEKLTIINVIPESKDFKNEKGWAGIFTTTDTNIETTYKVKTFPNSFLIGKDGKLLLSPAPNPIDGFDRQLGQILKSDYYKELQKKDNPVTK